MCHRYIQTSDLDSLRQELLFSGTINLAPRHNIRPQQQVPVIYPSEAGNSLKMMRWGIQSSSWRDALATDVKIAEQSSEDTSESSLAQRCLIPADGFYECEKRASQTLQPWLVRLIEDGPFCFAGIWQTTRTAEGLKSHQCALLTVMDNGTIAPLATRVPVILARQDYAAWLDPDTSIEELRAMLKPYRESGIYWHPVSPEILDSNYDMPSLAEPAQLIAA
jgi:putative SOS response-associated peptidase YedK